MILFLQRLDWLSLTTALWLFLANCGFRLGLGLAFGHRLRRVVLWIVPACKLGVVCGDLATTVLACLCIMINLTFVLKDAVTNHGQNVFVVGSIRELGQWDVSSKLMTI